MRAIPGKDAAVRAICAGQTNPSLDGAILAEIAWEARDNGKGQIPPGAFLEVEFMIGMRRSMRLEECGDGHSGVVTE